MPGLELELSRNKIKKKERKKKTISIFLFHIPVLKMFGEIPVWNCKCLKQNDEGLFVVFSVD